MEPQAEKKMSWVPLLTLCVAATLLICAAGFAISLVWGSPA